MTKDMLEQIRTKGAATPQSRQADPRQEQNNAGGWAFTVNDETRLRRFLTMGTSGTYYVNAEDTTAESAALVLGWARDNAARLAELATEISVAGRAPRQGPALLALMAAMALGDVDGRRAAASAFPAVVRTGTHLFTAAKYTEQFRGWGPVARRAFASWYLGKDPDELAYQLVKYRGREDWTHLDVLRSAHSTKNAGQAHRDLFNWLAKGVTERDPLPKWIEAYELVRGIERSGETLTARTRGYVQLIRDYPGLPWEALPDEATSQADVWRALVDAGMPVTALIRNLARLTRLGVLAPLSSHLAAVCARLRDQELLRKGRVHPVALLVAAKVYASGRAEKGSTTWVPVPQVTDALTDAFYLAFGAVEPSGKRVNLAVDISGSMASSAAGYCITAREMAAAMALVTAATEPRHVITAFTHGPYPSKWSGINGTGSGITPMPVSPRQRIDDVMRTAAEMTMGGTNCAVPMLEAARHRMPVDTFVQFTDNETWYGSIHPHEALENYRQVMGIDARLQVVAFTPTRFSVARPDDPRELDVSGFDASVPVLLADHSAGRI